MTSTHGFVHHTPRPTVNRSAVRLALCCCTLLLWSGCAAPVRDLWPPPADAPGRTIYVSLDAWHAMIALPPEPPLAPFVPSNAPEIGCAPDCTEPTGTGSKETGKGRVEEWGYAERAWYLEGRQGPSGVLRALFWPTDGVVEVGLHDQVWAARSVQPPAELFMFRVSEEGYQRLRRHVRATIASSEPILVTGTTVFYPATRSYHLLHHCHHYAALALREAGLPITVFWAFNRASLVMQLERAVEIADDSRVAAHRLP